VAITYRQAGVDIDAASDLVSRIAKMAKRTKIPEQVGGIGGFAGLCALPAGMTEPLLVSGTDGVGTKLKVAFAARRHDTVGIDLVAMCVNDIICCGARPLFFLDYFATGKLEVEVGEAIVRGIVEGCVRAGCALLGGETAELPGMYPDGEYDLAGFAVGVVERARVLDGSRTAAGDVVIGVASSGLHSNGYSLARRVIEGPMGLAMGDRLPLEGDTRRVSDVLLEPTRIYASAAAALGALGDDLRGMAHITGGGLPENLPRVLPDGLGARLDLGSWTRPAVFQLIAERGPVEEPEMRRTFNCGVGLCVVVAPAAVERALSILRAAGETAWPMGRIEAASGRAGGGSSGEERVAFEGTPR
jgi:phosphoribosylformylglycinamidine cyclo-ligase